MSRVSHLPKNVPSKEIPFKFKVKGSVNVNHTYEGDFVVKVPGVREMSKIGVELARLNDGDFDIQVTLLPDQKHERVILRFPNAPQDAPLGHDDYLEAVAALLAMDEPPVVTDVVSLDLIQFVVEQAKASQ